MRRKSRVMIGALSLAFMLTGFSGITAMADEATTFVPGTTVNSISVGGMTVEEAKARIEGFYASDYQLTITEKGGKQETIKGSDIGYRVTVPDGLQAILDQQNASGRDAGPQVDNSNRLEMTAVYDEAALTAKIQSLDVIVGAGVTVTADAHISAYQEGQPFTIVPEVYGNNVDTEKTAVLLKAAVGAGNREVNLEQEGCYYTVTVTSDNEQLKLLMDTMNQCRDMTITYVFGEQTEVLPGSMICTWLTGSQDGQIMVDREQAGAYVRGLADKYNTAGSTRAFRSSSGRDVQVSGSYGWKIDQEAETDALISMIRTGQTQSREPQYAQAAASRTGYDWGNTYVEVDLSGQHVYMVKDGTVVWDAPCVTGNVSKGHTTPPGIFTLAYKQRDKVLRGAKQADGSYEYESPVSYWMPFNGGIGLHDANWRSKFGGTIYKSGGSHGCVNLPPSKVPQLYDLVYKGIPVICYN